MFGALAELAELLFPLTCAGCGAGRGVPVCAACRPGLRPAAALPAPPGLDACVSVFSYEGVAREVVARVKYRGVHAATGWLARDMVLRVPLPLPELVTWAPTAPTRHRERGFDHAELLAREVGRLLRRPVRRLLTRPDGPAQTGATAAARLHGPEFDPVRSLDRRLTGASTLLVDDVVTTGATLTAAARVLRRAGAARVVALTAARTPRPCSTPSA